MKDVYENDDRREQHYTVTQKFVLWIFAGMFFIWIGSVAAGVYIATVIQNGETERMKIAIPVIAKEIGADIKEKVRRSECC